MSALREVSSRESRADPEALPHGAERTSSTVTFARSSRLISAAGRWITSRSGARTVAAPALPSTHRPTWYSPGRSNRAASSLSTTAVPSGVTLATAVGTPTSR